LEETGTYTVIILLVLKAYSDSKQSKIDELLTYIEDRLQELEEEKEELKEFQQSDKERRCLEYALFSRDLQDVTAAMEEVCLFRIKRL
jgi:structural maintenance of chromosome 3 (chondroitin sulfate proteoglycan 6)